MAGEPLRILLRRLGRASDAALSDAQLLERFVRGRDEAAFETFVWRHGAMVLNLCRRVLRHEQDAEDAFQATFLILARKAGSIGKRESCASWLYKVALRVALAARSVLAERLAREQPCPDELPAAEVHDDLARRELRAVLDEEVGRLPPKYRAAFVLCCLQGRSSAEAAGELGCPQGTVLSRLSRARQRLRQRLLRRGVPLSAALLAVGMTGKGQAGQVPAGLVATTSNAALALAAGKTAAAVAPARAAALTEGVLRAMLVSKLKLALGVVVVALGLGGLGAAFIGDPLVAAGDPAGGKPKLPPVLEQSPPATEKKPDSEDPSKAALRRLQSQDKLKEIGLALHNYNDTYGKLPAPAIYSRDGKPLLSWRVALLPFVEQNALYKAFHLDEPWDSDHNKKLLAQLPAVYTPPGQKQEGDRTYYQAIVGQGAAWEPKQQLRMPASFPDGLSNTILVVEAATPVPWSKPEDLPFVPDQALPRFGGLFDGNFHALLGDGSVAFLSARADEEQLRLAITRADGVPVDFDKITVAGGGRGPRVDLDDLLRENRRLKEAVSATLKEVTMEKGELERLKAPIAAGNRKRDPKTAKLLDEQAELRRQLDQAREQLEALRAERQRLEGESRKPTRETPKTPTPKP